MYVCNVDENSLSGNKYTDIVKNIALKEGNDFLILCAKIEAELAQIKDISYKNEMLKLFGINDSGLGNLIKKPIILWALEPILQQVCKKLELGHSSRA